MNIEELLLEDFKDKKFKAIKDEKQFIGMVDHYMKQGDKALAKSHFELARETGIEATKWAEFLESPRIAVYIKDTMASTMTVKARKAMLELGDANTSVDVAKAREFARNAGKLGDNQKEIKVFLLPSEVIKYRDMLDRIKNIFNEYKEEEWVAPMRDAYAAILTVRPDKQDTDASSS